MSPRPVLGLALVLALASALPIAAEPAPASPDDGGTRYWEVTGVSKALNLRQEPSTSAPVVGALAGGTVLHNLGCRYVSGRAWCEVQAIGGGPVGHAAAEYLRPALSPNGAPVSGPNDSATRAGRGAFDARGRIPCAQRRGQPMGECEFGVARAGGGDATVVVTRPDGRPRALYFFLGRASGADTSQADWGEFSASRQGDLSLVRVGEERYEIPDAVVLGG